jgi:hypothetical protein
MRRMLWIALLMMAAGLPGQLAAQATRADSAAVLLTMAKTLRAEGRSAQADAMLALILERYADTPAATEAQQLRAEAPRRFEERSGKSELLVWTTTYGLILGALVPAAVEADSEQAYGLGLILGGPTGFFVGRGISGSRPVSEGQARAISFGTLWGMWQGGGWASMLNDNDPDDDDDFDVLRGMLIGSLAGFGTGLLISGKPIRAGTSTAVTFGGLWGTFYGALLAEMADADGDTPLSATLLAGNAGVLATGLLAPAWNMSRGRARLISISGVAGLLAGTGVLLLVQPEDSETAVELTLLSSATIGLGLGAYWTRNYDERETRSSGPGGDALLDLRQGRWSINMPAPTPRLLETRTNGKPDRELGVTIPILKATFR